MKRKKSRGVVILCVYLILCSIGGIGMTSFAKLARSINLNIPVEEKMKMIQTEQYKKLNITNIEQFDEYLINSTSIVLNPYSFLTIILSLVFAIGIWLLLNWARVGLISAELFNLGLQLLWIIVDVKFIPPASRLFNVFISVIIIYFLTRPKVKGQFVEINNQSEGPNVTANV